MKKPKIKIVDNLIKGLDIYSKPYEIVMNKERDSFYYSEVGVLVSCTYVSKEHADPIYLEKEYKNPDYWLPKAGKFVINIQYDYRYADDQNTFDCHKVSKSGTRSEMIISDTIDSAIKDMLSFLDRPLDDDCKATIRETALHQSLHHKATFYRHRKETDLYEEIILNSKYADKYREYIKVYDNRRAAEFKYRDKLHDRFKKVFKKDLSNYVSYFKFNLFQFTRSMGIKDDEIKAHPNFRLLKKVAQYYN